VATDAVMRMQLPGSSFDVSVFVSWVQYEFD